MNTNNNTLQIRFDTMRRRIARLGITKYEGKIEKARDKDFAKEQYLPSLLNYDFTKLPEDERSIISCFDYEHRLGYDADEIIHKVLNTIESSIEGLRYTLKYIEKNKLNLISAEENEEFKRDRIISRVETYESFLDEAKLIRFLAHQYALVDIRDYFKDKMNPEEVLVTEPRLGNSQPIEVTWSGSKIDFIRLVYGLHHAGLLNQGRGEITKQVESMAYHFNVKLGPGWQADLSNTKTRSNLDTDHGKVFEKGKEAFLKYIKN